MPEYDFEARIREEIEPLQRELAEPGVREDLARQATRFSLPPDEFLAALFRGARRTGYTLRVMLDELAHQQEREAAAAMAARRDG